VNEEDSNTAGYSPWDEPGEDRLDTDPAGAGTWTLKNMPDTTPAPATRLIPDGDGWDSADGTPPVSESDRQLPDETVPGPGRKGPARDRTIRASSLRLLAVTVPVLVCIAALAYAIAPGTHPVSIIPADNPAATAAAPTPPASGTVTSPAGASPMPAATATPAVTAADVPVISKAAAQSVLAAFWTANNTANQDRSGALLANIETGSSYDMDAGQYHASLAKDPANPQYIPFDAMNAVYYIPSQAPGTYPRWWAARITYANLSSPQHATSAGFMIFSQASAGAAWEDTLEPYFWSGSGPSPFIRTDAAGYALQQAPQDGSGLSTAPAEVPALTAAALDGTSSAITSPGNLADLYERTAIENQVPAGTTVTDTHSAPGPVYALQAVGGTLAFFALTAQLSITAADGQPIEGISIPGYLSPGQRFTSAAFSYTDQFAVFIPAGTGSPYVVADASGITGQG
jgi:hypothetical protein